VIACTATTATMTHYSELHEFIGPGLFINTQSSLRPGLSS